MSGLKQFESRVFTRMRREPPKGFVHRSAFWLLLVYLALCLTSLLPGTAGTVFGALSSLTLFALVILCIPLLWRWVFGRLLWKVRNRLVVTYLLMGLTPVVLFVTLALILLYVFSGQFAIFAATSELNNELAQIASENEAFAMHIAHVLEAEPGLHAITLPEADEVLSAKDYSGIHAIAFRDGHPLTLAPALINATDIRSVPAWAPPNWKGVVLDQGQLFLRAIATQSVGGHRTTVITSLPLQKQNVERVAKGLGTVTVAPNDEFEAQDGPETNAGKVHVKVGNGRGIRINGENANEQGPVIIGGKVPRPTHFYDIPVLFSAPLMTVDWATGQQHESHMDVSSRPSLLYQRLFITSLRVAAVVQEILIGIAIFFGLLELIAFLMAVRLNRTITRSVHQLYEATLAIDSGNFEHRIRVKRRDQLAALSVSFNRMTASLERLLEEQREKQRLQSELAIAQEVQANLFPHEHIELPMLDLHGVCLPARTVSGDYYDFLVLGKMGLGLALGDISGKGISAALLMATLHSAVRAYRFAGEELVTAGAAELALPSGHEAGEQEIECGEIFEEPARILGLLNRHLYRSTQPEKYATLFLAHYDGRSSRLIYSTGGHLPPLLLRGDGSTTRLDCGGTVVGLLDNMVYEQGTEHLNSGDILIAYSDGVTEPENEFGEFGEARLVEIVRRHRHLPLEAISEQVIQALRSWIGDQEQPDDITLVLARQR